MSPLGVYKALSRSKKINFKLEKCLKQWNWKMSDILVFVFFKGFENLMKLQKDPLKTAEGSEKALQN